MFDLHGATSVIGFARQERAAARERERDRWERARERRRTRYVRRRESFRAVHRAPRVGSIVLLREVDRSLSLSHAALIAHRSLIYRAGERTGERDTTEGRRERRGREWSERAR